MYERAKGSRVVCFASHQNPDKSAQQKLTVYFQPAPRLKKLEMALDLGSVEVKGRTAAGTLITDNAVKRIGPFKA